MRLICFARSVGFPHSFFRKLSPPDTADLKDRVPAATDLVMNAIVLSHTEILYWKLKHCQTKNDFLVFLPCQGTLMFQDGLLEV